MSTKQIDVYLKVAYAILTLTDKDEYATFDKLCTLEFLNGLSRNEIKKAIQFLWDWGHLRTEPIPNKNKQSGYERAFRLEHPETVRPYAKFKGWST